LTEAEVRHFRTELYKLFENAKAGEHTNAPARGYLEHLLATSIADPPQLPLQSAAELSIAERMVERFSGQRPQQPLVFLRAETMWIRRDHDYGESPLYVFRDTYGEQGDVYCAVASFRNDAGHGQTATVYGLKAILRLIDHLGEEIGTGITGACWLGRATSLIDLEPDESARLLVMANNATWAIPWKEISSQGHVFDRSFPLPGPPVRPITVEIRLRDRTGNLMIRPLPITIALVRGQMTVTSRQPL